jgi:DNA topoisomerase-1
VHPSVIDAYLDGDVVRAARRKAEERLSASLTDVAPEEAAVLALLRDRLAAEEANAGAR